MRVHAGIVPGLFTMANMFCGYYSVILSASGEFVEAAWFIIAAGLFDVLDGKMARITQSSSDFGVQYDSLADVISFGFAPSALAYYILFHQWGTVGLLMSFLPLTFGAVRLARFNVRTTEENNSFFEGLPSPAAAMVIASCVIFNYELWGHIAALHLFVSLTILASLLMVTTMRYEKVPNFSLNSSAQNRFKLLIVVIGGILIVISPKIMFFPLMMLYAISGLLRTFWLLINPRKLKESQKG